jgi:hypothetical protein
MKIYIITASNAIRMMKSPSFLAILKSKFIERHRVFCRVSSGLGPASWLTVDWMQINTRIIRT